MAAAIAVVLLFGHIRARGENETDVTAWIQYLAAQVKELKAELITCRIEVQEQVIAQSERELAEIHKDQLRLQSDEASLNREFEQSQNLPAAPSAGADPTQFDLDRSTLFQRNVERLKSQHAALAQNEAAARERLRTARERSQILSQEARAVSPQSEAVRR